jgi:hypothetical protein
MSETVETPQLSRIEVLASGLYHFTIRTRQTKMEREELNVLVWQESLS